MWGHVEAGKAEDMLKKHEEMTETEHCNRRRNLRL